MCARDIRGKVFRDWIRSVVLRKFPVSGRHNSRLNFSWPAAVPQFHVAVKSNFVYVLQLNVLRYRPAHAPEKLGWVIDVQLGSQSPAQVTFVDLISKGGLPRPELSGLSRCCRVMLDHPAIPLYWAGGFAIHQLVTLLVTPAKERKSSKTAQSSVTHAEKHPFIPAD